MNTGLAIIGCGARTPLGMNLPSSAAAVRAGISAIGAHPFLLDRFCEPMKVALDAGLDPRAQGLERLLALALPAACEALAPLVGTAGAKAGTPSVSVVLSAGEPRPGLPASVGEALTDALCDALSKTLQGAVRIGQRLQWMGGHAGGLVAMETARRLLAEGGSDAVLVGGVDSYMARDTLEWLDDNEQLHSEGNIYGFCPGEAAGFVLLTRADTAKGLGLRPLLALVSVGSGIEKNRIRTEDICLGEGLAAAFQGAGQALQAVQPQARIDHILCDMNGERYRGNEYGFAILRTQGLFRDPAAFKAPADGWGDVGAASGPLCIGLVAAARARHTRGQGELSLVWASSEGGRRAAAIVQRWEVA